LSTFRDFPLSCINTLTRTLSSVEFMFLRHSNSNFYLQTCLKIHVSHCIYLLFQPDTCSKIPLVRFELMFSDNRVDSYWAVFSQVINPVHQTVNQRFTNKYFLSLIIHIVKSKSEKKISFLCKCLFLASVCF